MRAKVDSGITLPLREVPSPLRRQLIEALSFDNPAFVERLRRGGDPGSEVEKICLVEEHGDELRLPRGAVNVLRSLAAEHGLTVTFEDARVLPNVQLGPMKELSLRDYQQAAVDKFARISQGTIVMPCGAGKGHVGAGVIAKLRTPTLILVHTLDLAEQWLGQLRDKLGIEAGLIGDGQERIEPVTVAIVQSLVRLEESKLDELLGKFGLIIQDECHHVGASIFRRIVDRCPARYRLGLTATPVREDGLSPLLDLYFGPVLVKVAHQQLTAAGVLTMPEIRYVVTNFNYPYFRVADYVPMLSALAEDAERNRLVVEHVAREAHAGNVCLVLSGRVEHCHFIAQALERQGISAAVLTGEVKRDERKALLDEARAGTRKVLVATSLADEGLDIPRLSRVFLAFPGRARGRTEQRLGRLMRPHADKADAVLFDFVDRNVPILYRHHLARRSLYREVLGNHAVNSLGVRPSTSTRCAEAR